MELKQDIIVPKERDKEVTFALWKTEQDDEKRSLFAVITVTSEALPKVLADVARKHSIPVNLIQFGVIPHYRVEYVPVPIRL